MRRARNHWLTLIGGALMASACSSAPTASSFDASRFTMPTGVALCFDLDVAGPPVACLSIDARPPDVVERHSVVVPFGIESVSNNRALFTTWASYDAYAIIDYSRYPGVAQAAALGIVPSVQALPDSDFQVENLRGTLHLAASGLKRRFFLRPSVDESVRAKVAMAPEVASAVAVRLPQGAEVFERRAQAAEPVGELEVRGAFVRTYLLGERPIDVVYQIPPTDLQKSIFEYGLKLSGVLIVPLVELALLTSSKVRRPRTRYFALGVGGAIELIVIVALLWWAFHIRTVSGPSALLEAGIAVVGAVCSALLVFIKADP